MAVFETQFLILKRTPYREGDWILAGISPDYGKISVIIRNGRKAEDGMYPEADIFREFDMEYSMPENSELGNVRSLELIADASGVADDPEAFRFAGAIASFALANSAPEAGLPLSYDVLRNILLDCAQGKENRVWSREEASALLKLTWLTENGLLPDPGKNADFLENVIDCGVNGDAMPETRPGYWRDLGNYLNSLIKQANLRWN